MVPNYINIPVSYDQALEEIMPSLKFSFKHLNTIHRIFNFHLAIKKKNLTLSGKQTDVIYTNLITEGIFFCKSAYCKLKNCGFDWTNFRPYGILSNACYTLYITRVLTDKYSKILVKIHTVIRTNSMNLLFPTHIHHVLWHIWTDLRLSCTHHVLYISHLFLTNHPL